MLPEPKQKKSRATLSGVVNEKILARKLIGTPFEVKFNRRLELPFLLLPLRPKRLNVKRGKEGKKAMLLSFSAYVWEPVSRFLLLSRAKKQMILNVQQTAI
ncbi:hypothetical protein HMPREF1988_00785 [Porphyromonas gingivalis F0185]|nr:hypothetical protein HMPREF1988_00785 [Porphyromonas gingivalis F0185]